MPELPEVEIVKRGLKSLLPGLVIDEVWYDWPKGFPNTKDDVDSFLIGATVIDVRRRAKVLMIDLSGEYSLVIHLKMTGQLVFVGGPNTRNQANNIEALRNKAYGAQARWGGGHPNDSLVGSLPDKSTRVILTFKNGGQLFFNDQRKFGWMRLIPTVEIPDIDFMKKVGPEPLESDFSADDFVNRLMKRKNSNIKAVLLDQTIIAGVGNIYADESLYSADIHPESIVLAVPTKRLKKLYDSLVEVLKLSIEKGGSTDRNYVDALGNKGSYIEYAKVFRREKQDCLFCGHEIIKIKVAGRGTHVCTHCQKLYRGKK